MDDKNAIENEMRAVNLAISLEREHCARIAENAHTGFEQSWEDCKDVPFPEHNKIRKKMGAFIATKIRQRGRPT